MYNQAQLQHRMHQVICGREDLQQLKVQWEPATSACLSMLRTEVVSGTVSAGRPERHETTPRCHVSLLGSSAPLQWTGCVRLCMG